MDKNRLEKIKANIDFIAKKTEIMLQNRLILAIFMICDGACFVINPTSKIEFVARSIAFCVIIASGAIIINNVKSEHKDKKILLIAITVLLLGIIVIIFPKLFAMNIRILLAFFIILNGLINIFNIIKLDKVSSYISKAEEELKEKFEDDGTDKDYNRDAIIKEVEKVINPVNNFIKKTNQNSILYFILNIISIVLGLFLFTNQNITLIVCGVILIFTGLSDMIMYLKSNKSSKTNEKK